MIIIPKYCINQALLVSIYIVELDGLFGSARLATYSKSNIYYWFIYVRAAALYTKSLKEIYTPSSF